MKLKIKSIHGHGDFDKEHVLLQANEDCNIGHYLLADTTYNRDGTFSNKMKHTYWFLNQDVKKGDYVSVWTKSGADTVTKMKDGTPLHRFYWNLETAVWNDTGDCGLLVHTPVWQAVKMESE